MLIALPGRTSFKIQIENIGCQGTRGDQCTKRYSQGAREFFCGDEIVLYLDYTGSYMSLRMDKDTQNYTHKGECRLGLPWQASAWDSALPMQRGAWVQPLIGSRMP